MREQVSESMGRGLTAEFSGKNRRLLTEPGTEAIPFAVVRDRSIQIKHARLDEPEGNDGGEWFRNRSDVVRRLGGRGDVVLDIGMAQPHRENDRLIPYDGNGQTRDVRIFAESVESLDESAHIMGIRVRRHLILCY